MKKKKNIILTVSIVLGLILFFVVSFMISGNTSKPVVVLPTIDDWLADTQTSTPVVTIIGSTSCPHCQSYKPVITDLSEEYGFKLYFFETDTMSTDEVEKLTTSYEKLNPEYIPFTAVIQDAKVIDTLVGYESEEAVVDFLKKTEVIKN